MLLSFLSLIILFFCLPYLFIFLSVRKEILSDELLPNCHYALVLGAGLDKNWQPSDVLSDRVMTSIQLAKSGKVQVLVFSGSSQSLNYNEPSAMKDLALRSGLDESKIRMDFNGNSTLDSLFNFKRCYGQEEAIIVTQYFHLPRALWLAKKIGMRCWGFPAHIYTFSLYKRILWQSREVIAIPFNLIKLIWLAKN